ncbi:MAG: TolC family protein [Bacteroidales bacterium]|nr:TolC family protein [Bacteroidales bacterium]
MEAITVTVAGYFFDLLLAQQLLETAKASRENTAQMYAIAQERFNLGSLSRDEVLQLELKLLNDDLSISDCAVTEQVAMMRLRNYLGYNENVTLSLVAPEAEEALTLSYDDVLEKVFEHSSTLLGYEVKTLNAQRAVAQAKAAAGPSANLSARFGLNQVGSDLPAAYRNPLDQEVVGRDRYTAARERFLAGATSFTELNNAQSEMENASIRYLQDLASWWQYYYTIRQMTLYDYQKQFRIDETTYEEIPAAGGRAAAL